MPFLSGAGVGAGSTGVPELRGDWAIDSTTRGLSRAFLWGFEVYVVGMLGLAVSSCIPGTQPIGGGGFISITNRFRLLR